MSYLDPLDFWVFEDILIAKLSGALDLEMGVSCFFGD